ncbi:hypothetical protein F5B20DRAFT_590695 [Whalleya microplaca]|nr:hypothetical protein F5B20DRAFT_590695 [Whalleya microplaca]
MNAPPPTPLASTTPGVKSPLIDLWIGSVEDETPEAPESKTLGTDGCQAIVFYHACGCISKPITYFCSTNSCQHDMSKVIVGRLPFACRSPQGRSAECQQVDRAKQEFVREVDTADRLESLLVLDAVPKGDIEEFLPDFVGSPYVRWDVEIRGYCQSKRDLKYPKAAIGTLGDKAGASTGAIDFAKLNMKLEAGLVENKEPQNKHIWYGQSMEKKQEFSDDEDDDDSIADDSTVNSDELNPDYILKMKSSGYWPEDDYELSDDDSETDQLAGKQHKEPEHKERKESPSGIGKMFSYFKKS